MDGSMDGWVDDGWASVRPSVFQPGSLFACLSANAHVCIMHSTTIPHRLVLVVQSAFTLSLLMYLLSRFLTPCSCADVATWQYWQRTLLSFGCLTFSTPRSVRVPCSLCSSLKAQTSLNLLSGLLNLEIWTFERH